VGKLKQSLKIFSFVLTKLKREENKQKKSGLKKAALKKKLKN